MTDQRIAIITGATQGIGRAIINRLEKDSFTCINFDVKPSELSPYFEVNTADKSSVERAVQSVIDQYGRIDVLVNNAGILRDASLLKMTEDQWHDVININLTGVFNCTKVVAPTMVAQKSGKIVNLSSIVALYGNFGQTNYTAAKAGVIAMTKTWSKELGRKGINVNAIAPGFIQTDILKDMPEEVLDKMKAAVPLGRMGQPSDVANLVSFLVSDQSNYINGAVISIDGGVTL
jgi:3-oxoacyl-[acyl-carrier protein] reductase